MEVKKGNINKTPVPLSNRGESSPGIKLINKLNHDCLAKVLTYVSVLERFEMKKGKYLFFNF